MSKYYTTGEIAKLCSVSVRTVQYYDSRNILNPSELSDGGRRLYSESDLEKMQLICFLREMGFSIDKIGELFSESSPEKLISILIEQQESQLNSEILEKREKLSKLTSLKKGLKNFETPSVESLGDMVHIMKNQKKRRKTIAVMLAVGIFVDILEVSTVIYGTQTENWLPALIMLPIVIALCTVISVYYFKRTDYICPECHKQFHPTFKSAFWASHTPNTRRLTCPHCGHKGFCIETYGGKD